MKQEIKERVEKIRKGEVPEGYKETKVGIIPVDWKEENLGDTINYKKGFAFKSEDYTSNGVRIIRVSDTTYDSIKEDNLIYIEKTKKEIYSDYELLTNDLIVSTVGSKPPMYDSMVGKIIRIPAEISGSLLNQNAVRLRPKKDHQLFMIFYQLKTKRYLNYIKKIFRGNANQASITLEDLFQFCLVFPKNPSECEKIDCIINYWDKAIELKEKLIEEKKEFKRGLIQKLLAGEMRFPKFTGDWEETRLEKKLTFIKKESIENHQNYRLLAVKLHLKGIETTANCPKLTENGRPYHLRYEGELLIGRQNFHNGGIGIIPKGMNDYIASNAISSLKSSDDNLMYYYYYLSNPNFYKKVGHLIGGTGQKEISESMFKKLKIKLPSNDQEIKKISETITDIYHDLDMENKILKQLKEQKRGLMQLLLTGIVRVEVD